MGSFKDQNQTKAKQKTNMNQWFNMIALLVYKARWEDNKYVKSDFIYKQFNILCKYMQKCSSQERQHHVVVVERSCGFDCVFQLRGTIIYSGPIGLRKSLPGGCGPGKVVSWVPVVH